MIKKWFLVGVVLLLVPSLLMGCGVAQELYDSVVAERDSLAANLQSVQSELDAAKSNLQSIQSQLDALKLELESASSELESASSELESVTGELGTAKSEAESTQSELTAKESELQSVQSELVELRDELTEIKEVYPPRDFSSASELRDWLYSNTVSERPRSKTIQDWFAKALEIQEDALKDGYIISADIDYNEQTRSYSAVCVAIIDGEYWDWDPQSDEPLHYPQLGKVK